MWHFGQVDQIYIEWQIIVVGQSEEELHWKVLFPWIGWKRYESSSEWMIEITRNSTNRASSPLWLCHRLGTLSADLLLNMHYIFIGWSKITSEKRQITISASKLTSRKPPALFIFSKSFSQLQTNSFPRKIAFCVRSPFRNQTYISTGTNGTVSWSRLAMTWELSNSMAPLVETDSRVGLDWNFTHSFCRNNTGNVRRFVPGIPVYRKFSIQTV